jgi:hypothetical protein
MPDVQRDHPVVFTDRKADEILRAAKRVNGGGLPTRLAGTPLRRNPVIPYRTAATLPTPQYQYMVYQGVAQHVGGFDWIRAHPLI